MWVLETPVPTYASSHMFSFRTSAFLCYFLFPQQRVLSILPWSTSEYQSKIVLDLRTFCMTITQFWHHRSEGKWFYVEQAIAKKLYIPLRHRISYLRNSNSLLVISIYSLCSRAAFIGAKIWKIYSLQRSAQKPSGLGCISCARWCVQAQGRLGSEIF